MKKIILNHDLVKVIEEKNQVTLFIKMMNGQWAIQRPYPADLIGTIGALTLAIDCLAGKIILTETTTMNESELNRKMAIIESVEVKALRGDL